MKVYAYYEHHKDFRNDFDLIGVCADSWTKQGWEFELITRPFIERHPKFKQFNDRVTKLPTVNDRRFEEPAFRRWLALDMLGGGLLIDADVINFGYPVREYPHSVILADELESFPAPIYFTAEHAAKFVDTIIGWPDEGQYDTDDFGNAHTSDMNILLRVKAFGAERQRVCAVFGLNCNWRTSPLVHFGGHHMTKESVIRVLRSDPNNIYTHRSRIYSPLL